MGNFYAFLNLNQNKKQKKIAEGKLLDDKEKKVFKTVMICAVIMLAYMGVKSESVSAASGGEVCTPIEIEICSICGNNYNDPNGACTHWKGTEYGGTACDPHAGELCNICHSSINDFERIIFGIRGRLYNE